MTVETKEGGEKKVVDSAEIAKKAKEEYLAEKKAKEEGREYTPPSKKSDEEILGASEEDIENPEKFSEADKTRRKELLEAKEKQQAEEDEKLLATDDKDLDEEKITRKKELIKAKEEDTRKEEERLLNAKDEDLGEEELKLKQELIKKKDEQGKKKGDLDTKIEAYATEKGISVEEAREEFDSATRIAEKYKNDPVETARAALHLQRENARLQSELKNRKEAEQMPQITTELIDKQIKANKFIVTMKDNTRRAFTKDDIVEEYRKENPDETEEMEDETVYKVALKAIKNNMEKDIEDRKKGQITEAKEKRLELLNGLPEGDKKFLKDIKDVLDKQPDSHVLKEGFSLNDIVYWAKGKVYDRDLKEFGEAEFKRGQEQAKVLGIKSPSTGAKGSSDTKNKTTLQAKVAKMSDSDKERALNMYRGLKVSDEKKFEMFLEVQEDRKNRSK